MKALSVSQANRCENAEHPNCRCRCGGAFHGGKRVNAADGGRQVFEELPEDDPHHLPTKEEKKRRAEKRRLDRELAAGRPVQAKLKLEPEDYFQ